MPGVDTPVDRGGVMALRLWVEPSGRVLVRITRSTSDRPDAAQSYAATKGEVLRAVEEWLDAFVTPP